ncbi:hypothetical protein BC833DRAFT_617243 [Globomyces pollinis-pini]|nr:hypothetical protein BC833DRAFT_617243 [Globomyces pollinis-pini]
MLLLTQALAQITSIPAFIVHYQSFSNNTLEYISNNVTDEFTLPFTDYLDSRHAATHLPLKLRKLENSRAVQISNFNEELLLNVFSNQLHDLQLNWISISHSSPNSTWHFIPKTISNLHVFQIENSVTKTCLSKSHHLNNTRIVTVSCNATNENQFWILIDSELKATLNLNFVKQKHTELNITLQLKDYVDEKK